MQYQKKLNYFLKDHEHSDFNVRIYDMLYQDLDISHLFEPVDFFDVSYNEFLFFWHHNTDYLAITEHYRDLNFDTSKLYYIFYYLTHLINIVYSDKDTGSYIIRYDDIVLSSCAYVNKLFKKIEIEFEASNNLPVDNEIEFKPSIELQIGELPKSIIPILTLEQAALICHYLGRAVTRKNGDEFAKEYGHTSGDALFNKYTKYQSKANRTGKPNPCTAKKLMNKIILFEFVSSKLASPAKEAALADLKLLQNLYATEYE